MGLPSLPGLLLGLGVSTCSLLTLATFLVLLLGTGSVPGEAPGACWQHQKHHDWYQHLIVPVVAVPATWLASVAASWHLRAVATFLLWSWGSVAVNALATTLDPVVCTVENVPGAALRNPFDLINSVAFGGAIMANTYVAVRRVESLENGAFRRFGGRQLRKAWFAALASGHLYFVFYSLWIFAKLQLAMWPFFAVCGALLVLLMIGCVLLIKAFAASYRLVGEAAKNAPEWVARDAREARVLQRHEMACTAVTLGMTAVSAAQLMYLEVAITEEEREAIKHNDALQTWRKVVLVLDQLCNLLFALYLSGALTGAVRGTTRRAALTRERRRRRERRARAWLRRPEKAEQEESGWQAKVDELAGRGVSLAALLEFYGELPKLMTHFDGERHSTADVVRQAVIPLSSEQACAGATVIMKGQSARPHRMVTHYWGNKFRNLVAAVLADALGDGEYDFLAAMLDGELPKVLSWVQWAGVEDRTYWICAFSVNQHAGICAGNARHRDSVTQRPCPSCHCGLAKAWNDSPPLLPDGRSVACEMNKFDDMMRTLATGDSNFSQVLAVDESFATFTRAWCIAELAAANELGMVQEIKVGSAKELEERTFELKNLRVQDMDASRPEDKALILAGIPDHEAFNKSMQKLLFEDLFPAWASLDAQERMASAGRYIRWMGTSLREADKGDEPAATSSCREASVCV